MNYTSVIVIGIALILVTVGMYVVLPRLHLSVSKANKVRAVLFFGVVSYLAYDFLIKDKYMYIFVLLLGCIGFLFALRNMQEGKDEQDDQQKKDQ